MVEKLFIYFKFATTNIALVDRQLTPLFEKTGVVAATFRTHSGRLPIRRHPLFLPALFPSPTPPLYHLKLLNGRLFYLVPLSRVCDECHNARILIENPAALEFQRIWIK